MATCEVCGNDDDNAMEISVAGGTAHTLGSSESGHSEHVDRA